jgi:phosphoglycerate dehydrogenase-like enzyme
MAVVAKGIRKLEDAILNPLVTGPFLYVLTRGPASIREPLLRQLATLLSEENIRRLVAGLKWAFALGLLRNVNRWLNSVALSNWKIKAAKDKWIWDWEIAVVTGGSSGIGAEITKALMRKGIKVAVLDIQPLPKDMDGCEYDQYAISLNANLWFQIATSSTSTVM